MDLLAHTPTPSGQVFSGRRIEWFVPDLSRPSGLEALSGLPDLAQWLLHRRGITTSQEAEDFLSISDSVLEDGNLLPGIGAAVARLHQAKACRDRVAVYGDFDADGVTGTALLTKALRRFGLEVAAYIPHRVLEGHGLNEAAVNQLHSQGIRLLVTVDCGVTDVAAISQAGSLGIDVIVTDHHLTGRELPSAVAVINPHAPESRYPFEHLTGVGMTLKLAQALLEPIEGAAWADDLLELAAIGTITDMAPLLGENRWIVARGIEQLRRTRSAGLLALMRVARSDPRTMDAMGIGFGIGPRLNAAGRLDHADSAYELLMTEDPHVADVLAEQLDGFNTLRRSLTADALEAARFGLPRELPPLILMGDESFHPGVVGLVAGKLAEETGIPAAIYALADGKVMGSCRSSPGFHWADALKACDGLLVRHGGHAQAAGFTCSIDVLDDLRDRLQAIAAETAGATLGPRRSVDAVAPPSALMGEMFQTLRRMEPFGMGNPVPLFLMRSAEVVRAAPMGRASEHFRVTLRAGGATWEGVAFRQEWVQGTRRADVVYSLSVDHWNGTERLRLQIEDYAPAD